MTTPDPLSHDVVSLHSKFTATRQQLGASLLEREAEIDAALTALIHGQHFLMVGPPGTAKSMLSDSICSWMDGDLFDVMLMKFSTPEELFGPISVSKLKEDKYERIVNRMLPVCDMAFIDEIFKGSSAILNTLLKAMNERTFVNGGIKYKIPLQSLFGASNEWPGDLEGGRELGALFDRFIYRRAVKPLQSITSRERLWWDEDLTPKLTTVITPDELTAVRESASRLKWTPEAKDTFRDINVRLRKEGIVAGDRRERLAPRAVQSFAWLNEHDEVQPEDCEILKDILWVDPAEQPAECARIVTEIANPTGAKVTSLLTEVEEILADVVHGNLESVVTAHKKLSVVAQNLKSIKGGNGRVKTASAYVTEQVNKLAQHVMATA